MIMRLVLALLVCLPLAAQADGPRWQKVEGRDCRVWNPEPQPRETASWDGPCKGGLATGRGTLVWRYMKDGQWEESVYEGEYRNGKEHGHVIAKWPNGISYEGGYRNGKHHGHGVFTWPGRYRYEGDWRDGMFYGNGVFTWANGDRYEGNWRDYPDGWGTAIIDGITYTGNWAQGCFNDGGRRAAILRDVEECR